MDMGMKLPGVPEEEGSDTSARPLPFCPFLTQTPLTSLLNARAAKMKQLTQSNQSQTTQAVGGTEDSKLKSSLGVPGNVGARSQGRFRELSAADRPRENTLRPITQQELEKHKSRSDCWVSLDGVVYDISNYLRFHPGGSAILLSVAGREAGREFRQHHPWVNYSFILENCREGILQRGASAQAMPHSTTLTPPNPVPPAFAVPSGMPQSHMKDPLRLALSQGRTQPPGRDGPENADAGDQEK